LDAKTFVFVAGSTFLHPFLALEASIGDSYGVWKTPWWGRGT
jgi:hypothetical protein